MFYSETLLQKTGPLSRAWLAANLQRKLTKAHVLQASVQESVEAMVKPDQAPMALRLSGQLLYGIVTIYSKKARYLLDDCNEALLKIKMAFRQSTNNDISADLRMPSRDALMLPDVLTEGDNLEMPPLPDASFLLSQLEEGGDFGRKHRAGSLNLQDDFQNSQFLHSSIERNDFDDEELLIMDDEDDLGLDLGEDDDITIHAKNDRSVEIGRDAPEARPVDEDVLSEMDFQITAKDNFQDDRDQSLNLDFGGDDAVRIDAEGDVDMFNMGDGADVSALPVAPVIDRARISESPLSDIDDTVIQKGEAELRRGLNASNLYEPQDETEHEVIRNPAQRARRHKTLQADTQTMLTTAQVKSQQENRDKITQAPSFLPRDPELLALMEMQKNGGFISNIMGEGRSSGWAPELQGLFSLDVVRRNGELKRKRDSGVADLDSEEEAAHKSPRLELGEDDEEVVATLGANAGVGREESAIAPDGTILEMAGDDEFQINMNVDEEEHNPDVGLVDSPGPNFDETSAPLVHPADNGPVSLGTKHAVHLLRERFGPEAENSPDKRKKANVLFHELLPESTTSRADATKMFFEILVLATKDAVKIEQPTGVLGGPIRVRGKRGLWGAWAEREAGGEIEEEAEAAPGAGLEAARQVSVAA